MEFTKDYLKGWNDGKREERERWIKKFKEFACLKDDGWFIKWLEELNRKP